MGWFARVPMDTQLFRFQFPHAAGWPTASTKVRPMHKPAIPHILAWEQFCSPDCVGKMPSHDYPERTRGRTLGYAEHDQWSA